MKHDLRSWPVSESVRRLNPHLFKCAGVGGLQVPEPEPAECDGSRAEDPGKSPGKNGVGQGRRGQPRGGPLYRVTLVSHRRRELDRDNLIGGLKALRDTVADMLNIDDSEKCVDWQYAQIITRGEEGTSVRIELTGSLSKKSNPKKH